MANSKDYDYRNAGFDSFLTRSIEDMPANNLEARPTVESRQLNYDQSQVSGSLGDILQIGKINIDGVEGRINIEDENGNVVTEIGKLSE